MKQQSSVLYFTFSFQIVPECSRNYFLYAGKCYSNCPERTFIVPEEVVADDIRSKGLSVKRRASNVEGFDRDRDQDSAIVKNRAIMLSSLQKLCGSCHEACLKCNGPLESDCVLCDQNYNQIIIGSSISCDRKSNNATATLIEAIHRGFNEHSTLKVALIGALIAVLVLISSISIYLLRRKLSIVKVLSPTERDGKFSAKYSYNQLAENEENLLAKLNRDDSDDE